MIVTPSTNFIELLDDVLDVLEDYEDADMLEGRYVPNKAMRLSERVRQAIKELEGLQQEAEWPDDRG